MGERLRPLTPRTHFESPPHLTVATGADAKVVPLFGEQPGKAADLSPTRHNSPSATAMRGWLVQSLLVEAIVRDESGHGAAAERALERALELAVRDRVLLPFLLDPPPINGTPVKGRVLWSVHHDRGRGV